MHNLNELDMCIDLTPAELEELKGGVYLNNPEPTPWRPFPHGIPEPFYGVEDLVNPGIEEQVDFGSFLR